MGALRDKLTEMQHDLEALERFARMSTGSTDGLAVGSWPSEPPCASEPEMRSLVEQYPQMCAFAERLRLREFESLQHFVSPQVFDSEVRVKQQMVQDFESTSQLLKVKDQMIWTLLDERETMRKEHEELQRRHAALEEQMEQLNKESVDEIQEWVQLNDRVTQQNEQLKAQLNARGSGRAEPGSFRPRERGQAGK